jgi:hypothetical protein
LQVVVQAVLIYQVVAEPVDT